MLSDLPSELEDFLNESTFPRSPEDMVFWSRFWSFWVGYEETGKSIKTHNRSRIHRSPGCDKYSNNYLYRFHSSCILCIKRWFILLNLCKLIAIKHRCLSKHLHRARTFSSLSNNSLSRHCFSNVSKTGYIGACSNIAHLPTIFILLLCPS